MKTVLITGAGGNLGSAVVKRFVTDGWQVLAIVSAGKTPAEKAKGVDFFEVDLVDEQAVNTMIHQISSKYKTLDAALLLAGGFEAGGVDKTDGAALMRMYSLNFETAYHIARAVFNRMLMQPEGGKIVFVGARPALEPKAGKGLVAYGLSKSLLFKLSEYLNAAGGAKIEPRTSNLQPRTSNLEPPASNLQPPTSNLKPPTSSQVTSYVIVPSTIDTPQNRKDMPKADFSKWQTPEGIAKTLSAIAGGSWTGETMVKLYE